MKSDRRYIRFTLLVQMVLLPIILTIFFIGFYGSLSDALSKGLPGKDSVIFFKLIISFITALFVGGITGIIFSGLYKSKPDSAMSRYFAPLFPVIYALVFAIAVILLSKGNYNSGYWGMYVVKNPFFLFMDLIFSLYGLPYAIPVVEISGYSGFFAAIILLDGFKEESIRNAVSRNIKIGFAASFVIFLILISVDSKQIINNGIVELKYGKSTIGKELTEFDLESVAPFKENNGVAKLDGEASLQFTHLEEMPRLDGATAAYPVYSAFVQAVYKGLGEYYVANKSIYDKDSYLAFVSSDKYPYNIVKCSKTNSAYDNLINGKTDIIFVAEPSKAQTERIKAKGDEFLLTPIGSEAFVFFTNKENPIENLTIKQMQDIYSGKITNWKEVGGESRRIVPYQRPQDSGSQTIMQNKVMKDIEMLKPTTETYAGGMGEIINQVAGYKNAKNALGYSFMYYSSSMIKNNQIKYISIDGVKPTTDTVRDKTYPFTVPVYAVTLKSNTNKNINTFIEWILTKEGQSLVEKTGYVSMK